MKPFFLALAAVVVVVAVPRGAAALSDDATQEQVQAALQELSVVTGQGVATVDEAAKLCDQEKYLEACAEIGKRHDLYDDDEVRQVDTVLTELKGEVSQKLAACESVECLVAVADDLAKKISAKNPAVASQLSLTTSAVKEKEAIVIAAREAGVRFEDCETMDPDAAPLELLRACAKLAKDSRVQKYIPEPIREQAGTIDQAIGLRVALESKEIQCGDGTLEGCGNFCLNPNAEARAQGAAVIPPICRQIAERFFGAQGIQQLESSHQQITTATAALSTKLALVMPDGRQLVGRDAIKGTCDQAFERKDIALVRACGDFAVQNGFAPAGEVEKGIQLLETLAARGQGVDFNECLRNPKACEDFIPEDRRQEFTAGIQIDEIMRREMGFDPRECERGEFDESIGQRCFEGSKRALPELEKLAATSPDARRIVSEIKGHIAQGERLIEKKDDFRRTFEAQGGPGGCTSERDCRAYCSDSANGAECLAFGAQQGVFRADDVTQRFQNYQQSIQQTIQFTQPTAAIPHFPGQGPYQGFQPPGYPGGQFPPGQQPGFTQPGPGFYPPPGYPYPGQPAGPSPECFTAIQRGDFVKARELCALAPQLPPVQPPGQSPEPGRPGVCPAYPYIPCPSGFERDTFTNRDGCTIYGQCRSTYTQPSPAYTGEPTYCPPPSYWDPASRSCRQPGPPYSTGPYPDDGVCRELGDLIFGCHTMPENPGVRFDSSMARYVIVGTRIAKNCSTDPVPGCSGTAYTYTPGPGGFQCSDGKDNDNDGKTDYPADTSCYGPDDGDEYYPPPGISPGPTYSPGPGGVCSQELINLLGTGCHNMGNAWFDGQMTRYVYPGTTKVESCSTYWISSCSGGNTTYPGDANSCPGFSYSRWDQSGRRYCQLNETRACDYDYPSYLTRDNYSSGECPADTVGPYPSGSVASCPAGQWWDGATQSCRSSSPAGQCPLFAHDMGGYCMLNNDTSRCAEYSNAASEGSYTSRTCQERNSTGGWTNNPSPQSCPSGQYWYYPPGGGASYCKYGGEPYPSGSPYPTYTYSPPQSCPSGQYWYYPSEGGSGYCRSNESYPSYTPYPSTYTQPSYSPPPPSEAPPPPPPSEAPPPPPPSESPPPPAVLAANIHSCVNVGGAWTGNGCYLPRRVGFADAFLASIAEPFRWFATFFR